MTRFITGLFENSFRLLDQFIIEAGHEISLLRLFKSWLNLLGRMIDRSIQHEDDLLMGKL